MPHPGANSAQVGNAYGLDGWGEAAAGRGPRQYSLGSKST